MEIQKLGLGQIIETEQQRDAVHIAVAPVTAGDRMNPGEHVGLLNGKASYAFTPHIGVIDPFLKIRVEKDEEVWLFLYPGTITGLRHEWSHPAFAQQQANSAPEPVSGVKLTKANAERWMRKWAMAHVSRDYDDGAKSEDDAFDFAIEAGETLGIGHYESARDYIDDEWWDNWEAITGKIGQRGEYFSCAC